MADDEPVFGKLPVATYDELAAAYDDCAHGEFGPTMVVARGSVLLSLGAKELDPEKTYVVTRRGIEELTDEETF